MTIVAVCVIKLLHSEKVISRETSHAGLRSSNVLGQLWHDAIAPLSLI
jgi:hypothetical protein